MFRYITFLLINSANTLTSLLNNITTLIHKFTSAIKRVGAANSNNTSKTLGITFLLPPATHKVYINLINHCRVIYQLLCRTEPFVLNFNAFSNPTMQYPFCNLHLRLTLLSRLFFNRERKACSFSRIILSLFH